MKEKYRAAHARAVRKYNHDKIISIDLRLNREKMRPGFKADWKAAAEREGLSLSQFIYRCVEKELEQINRKESVV